MNCSLYLLPKLRILSVIAYLFAYLMFNFYFKLYRTVQKVATCLIMKLQYFNIYHFDCIVYKSAVHFYYF
jgi:hypothetical protein